MAVPVSGSRTANRRSRLTRLRTLAGRPNSEKWLVLQAVVLLGIARLAILVVPYRRLESWMGERLAETPADAPVRDVLVARRVAWAIHAVSPSTPWASNCFPQALTAKVLLRRRGIPTTLYLGAALGGPGLRAHAWLRCGPFFVTGGRSRTDYGTLVSYA